MWFRKIMVQTSATDTVDVKVDKEFLKETTKEFCFYYTPFTKNEAFLRAVCAACNHMYNVEEVYLRFLIYANDQYYHLAKNAHIAKVFHYIGCNESVSVKFVIGLLGGGEFASENGIHYLYHTKELRHVPHIHARYQGEEISIEIISLKVRGKLKNKKKQAEAVDYVDANKTKLLQEYNQKTNGIHIDEFFIEDGEMTPKLRG